MHCLYLPSCTIPEFLSTHWTDQDSHFSEESWKGRETRCSKEKAGIRDCREKGSGARKWLLLPGFDRGSASDIPPGSWTVSWESPWKHGLWVTVTDTCLLRDPGLVPLLSCQGREVAWLPGHARGCPCPLHFPASLLPLTPLPSLAWAWRGTS